MRPSAAVGFRQIWYEMDLTCGECHRIWGMERTNPGGASAKRGLVLRRAPARYAGLSPINTRLSFVFLLRGFCRGFLDFCLFGAGLNM